MTDPEALRVMIIGGEATGKRSFSVKHSYGHFCEPCWGEGHEDETDLRSTQCVDGKMLLVNTVIPLVENVKYDSQLTPRYFISLALHRFPFIGFLFVYDITSQDSFNTMKELYEALVAESKGFTYPMMVVGLKSDLQDQRVVSQSEAESLAMEWKCEYMEVSAKNGRNVNECFEEILRKIKSAPPNPVCPQPDSPDSTKEKERQKCIVM